jgi:hypothetical protein
MATVDAMKVSLSYRAAQIIAGLLPGKHEYLSDEAKQAVIQFLGELLRTRTRMASERQKYDPET